jgi:hypothetical protein
MISSIHSVVRTRDYLGINDLLALSPRLDQMGVLKSSKVLRKCGLRLCSSDARDPTSRFPALSAIRILSRTELPIASRKAEAVSGLDETISLICK